MSRRLVIASWVALLASCEGAPRVGPALPPASTDPTSFSTFASEVLGPRCATQLCHAGNPPPYAPNNLEPDKAFANLVGQPSSQVAALQLVEPGNPDASYLVMKLEGTAASVGGVGTPMPPADDPLTSDELDALRAWILKGAPND